MHCEERKDITVRPVQDGPLASSQRTATVSNVGGRKKELILNGGNAESPINDDGVKITGGSINCDLSIVIVKRLFEQRNCD